MTATTPTEERMAIITREFEEIMALPHRRQEEELPRFFRSLTLDEHSMLLVDRVSKSTEEKARREFRKTLLGLFEFMHNLDKGEDIETLLDRVSPEVRKLFPDWSELYMELSRCPQANGNPVSIFISLALIEFALTVD